MKELTIAAASYLLIGLFGTIAFIFVLGSLRKKKQVGHPLRGILWFTLAVVCLCAVVLFADYLETLRVLETISHRVEAMISGL
jgi:uncharacterized membrane protein SirB2